MGFFGKKDPSPEDAIDNAPSIDAEKQMAPSESPAPQASRIPAIDPVLEARVVRKLDARVPVLLAFLCTTTPYLG